MTSFQALMALSASQTQQTKEAVQTALAERQRKAEQKRKEIEEKERKERELQAKLRLKRLEEQKREQERQERLERERQAKEREIQRREEQQRDALRYGPKKGGGKDGQGYPLSGTAAKRRHSPMSDDDEAGPSNVLTREEKRQRRLKVELGEGRGGHRRSATGGSGYGKAGRRLPGGAVDITTTKGHSSSQPSPGKSVRDRIAAEPPMLIKLNTNKRDTRTIDEILQDRAKLRQGKVLDGESAREFNDWFGKAKKDPPKKPSVPATSASTSRANTPAVGTSTAGNQSKAASGSASPSQFPSTSQKSHSFSKSAVPSSKPGPTAKAASTSKAPPPKPLSAKPSMNVSRTPVSSKAVSSASASKQIPKKRRSPSSSVSPPPVRRRPASGGASNDISSEIWKLFGKDRSSYIQRDVFSDDEDMEAGIWDVEKEEKISMRIAKEEDERALEEERRHEEEKRRRKKEKEKRGHH